MNSSTCLHPSVALPKTKSKAASRASQDPLLKMAIKDTPDDVRIYAWEFVLTEESQLWSEAAAAANNREFVKHESRRQIESCSKNKEVLLAGEAKGQTRN